MQPTQPTQSAHPAFPSDLLRAMPKAELHVHLEGTIDATTLLMLAERHGVRPPADTVEGVDAWYRFDGFPMFLERYFTVLGLLRGPEDFALVAERYLDTAHAQGVVHTEFHVSATGHIVENGKAWAPIHDGIVDGCTTAANRTGMSWGLIPDISPHLPASDCAAAMDEVFAHDLRHVLAIGMGGPADTWATDDFASIYRTAEEHGVRGVAHAGEHGGADEVDFALDHFRAERIQHGIGAMQNPETASRLVEMDVACDVCPGSNLALQAVPDAQSHPLAAMLDAGITVTLGTDDPPMFQTTLIDEYRRAWDWCGLSIDQLRQLCQNSLERSFAPVDRVGTWTTALAQT